ncbi:MAG: hypothetical protein JXB39_16220, partial [Deltaproteobacteria bacterium]|nr:hypothetical protein [Deltaproteobacteria bacterium]
MAERRTPGSGPLNEAEAFRRAMEGVVPLKRKQAARKPPRVKPDGEGPPAPAVRPARVETAPAMTPLPAKTARPSVPAVAGDAVLGARIDALEAEVRRLVADLAQARIDAAEATARALPDTGVRILSILEDRGLKGPDEASHALAVLLEQHVLDPVLPWVNVADAGRVGRRIFDRLGLSCMGPDCHLPGGPVVEVPPARCDVCGGESIRLGLRRFSDACLLSGITRILWVGGRARVLQRLVEGVDPRLSLRVQPGALPVAPPRTDEDWARIVIVWDDGDLSSEAATAGMARPLARVSCSGRALALACLAAAERIEALDPESLD